MFRVYPYAPVSVSIPAAPPHTRNRPHIPRLVPMPRTIIAAWRPENHAVRAERLLRFFRADVPAPTCVERHADSAMISNAM